jgi:hypothetical protein
MSELERLLDAVRDDELRDPELGRVDATLPLRRRPPPRWPTWVMGAVAIGAMGVGLSWRLSSFNLAPEAATPIRLWPAKAPYVPPEARPPGDPGEPTPPAASGAAVGAFEAPSGGSEAPPGGFDGASGAIQAPTGPIEAPSGPVQAPPEAIQAPSSPVGALSGPISPPNGPGATPPSALAPGLLPHPGAAVAIHDGVAWLALGTLSFIRDDRHDPGVTEVRWRDPDIQATPIGTTFYAAAATGLAVVAVRDGRVALRGAPLPEVAAGEMLAVFATKAGPVAVPVQGVRLVDLASHTPPGAHTPPDALVAAVATLREQLLDAPERAALRAGHGP